MRARRTRIAVAAVALAALVAGGSLALALRNGSGGTVALRGATIDNEPVAPAFSLVDQDGRPVSLRAQRGKVVLVTFLYTHCPDVCPLIASRLNAALPALGPDARVLAVSVDPHGDTAASVRAYVRARRLRPQFRYLRGTQAQLAPVWKAWFVGASPAPGQVLHTAMTVLVDREGRERVRYDASATAADVAHDVHALHL